ncbi:TetR/AcrR family transcriptional regulator [Thermosulfurimonas marina]|uniref:TetR/AcrR family transcriptional regulator n=1 Tax=Thermosulfurimonas marina TaxID=2047767 RepID=A0A6H1WS88_9BACT|nr:TetR/AcrR family transcriptional regulator [Thermosulfurimonas marina]QJA05996.1 TetR/AcrR family transcriptional regulator [Thermosulfurimonas marina]
MNRRSKKALRAELRREILAAALSVFSEKGFHGARMVDIARRAGVAVGTLYQFFSGKADLYQTLLEEVARRIHGRVLAVLRKEAPVLPLLREFLTVKLAALEENQDILGLHLREVWEARFQGVRARVLPELYEEYLSALGEVLSRLPHPLSSRPRLYAALVDGVIATAVVEALEGRSPFPTAKDLWPLLTRALIPEEEAHAP